MDFVGYGLKDWLEIVSYLVTSVSLIGLWYAYIFSKKQIHFTAMDKCIKEFRQISTPTFLGSDNRAEQYIELINEEFFYFEYDYLPMQVSVEWVDGMIDYLPFYCKNNGFIKSTRFVKLSDEQSTSAILYDYPRVRKALTIKKDIDFDKIYMDVSTEEFRLVRKKERDKLIYLIIANLKISYWRKLRLKKILKDR